MLIGKIHGGLKRKRNLLLDFPIVNFQRVCLFKAVNRKVLSCLIIYQTTLHISSLVFQEIRNSSSTDDFKVIVLNPLMLDAYPCYE